jgi:DNA (cytosine-5)-methyltransferase 1
MPNSERKIRTLSLFSGAGGLDIGFQKAGFDIVGCVEIEADYCQTLHANHGTDRVFDEHCVIFNEDVRAFADSVASSFRDVECVIGGPPCQTFSAAGRRSGGVLGTDDERGQLFRTYCDILEVIRPKTFVFENVYGLPGANNGVPWKEIVSAFSSLGYSLRAEVLDAADYGVPQHRERLILVGFLEGGYHFPLPTHGPDSAEGKPFVSSYEAIADLQDPDEPYFDNLGGRYGHLLPGVPAGLNYSFYTKEMGHPEPVFAWRSKFHDLLYKVDPAAPTRTIKARPGKFTGPFHWKNRHFTVSELKRLQSFPDDYEIVGSRNKALEQIGNSVPPQLAHIIARSVRWQVYGDSSAGEGLRVRPPGFSSTFRQRQRERSKHYKEIAARAIAERYALDQQEQDVVPNREVYYLRQNGFFESDIYEDPPLICEVGSRLFEIDVLDGGAKLDIQMGRRGVSKEQCRRVTIDITGLKKYLGRVDRVSVVAQLHELADLFPIWATIERELVARSRFFTLIDIYGHYANRGDVVRISADYEFEVPRPIERALQYFSQTVNCGAFISANAVDHELGLTRGQLETVVNELRKLRYDIRTRETHPTIDSELVIATYPFPLLSAKAHVQRKTQVADQRFRNTA